MVRFQTLHLLLAAAVSAHSQTQHQDTYNLLHFQEDRGLCRAKGRLQDKEYCRSGTMDPGPSRREIRHSHPDCAADGSSSTRPAHL